MSQITHALRDCAPLCGFTNKPPCHWPQGHDYDFSGHPRINCPDCLARQAKEYADKRRELAQNFDAFVGTYGPSVLEKAFPTLRLVRRLEEEATRRF
jgi:hypothetical protein